MIVAPEEARCQGKQKQVELGWTQAPVLTTEINCAKGVNEFRVSALGLCRDTSLWQLPGMPCLMQMCKYLCNIFFSHIGSCYCSVQFSCSVMSDSLQHHGLQHIRPPCLSSTPRVGVKLGSIESVMPSNHLILYCPLLLLPSIFPGIRVFSNESVLCIRWTKYWSFSFSIILQWIFRTDFL